MTSIAGRDAEQPVRLRSPPCRQAGERKTDCVKRKVKELMADEDMLIDQAIAVATKMCDKACVE